MRKILVLLLIAFLAMPLVGQTNDQEIKKPLDQETTLLNSETDSFYRLNSTAEWTYSVNLLDESAIVLNQIEAQDSGGYSIKADNLDAVEADVNVQYLETYFLPETNLKPYSQLDLETKEVGLAWERPPLQAD